MKDRETKDIQVSFRAKLSLIDLLDWYCDNQPLKPTRSQVINTALEKFLKESTDYLMDKPVDSDKS